MRVLEGPILAKGLRIAGPWPALYLEEERAVILSDLHIGLEDEMESRGIHIPATVFPTILEQVLLPIKHYNAEKIFMLGDIKHEFGRPTEPEWWGVKRLVKAIRSANCEPEVVRGNHDNYIISVLNELGVKLHDRSLELERFTLLHGHQERPDGVGSRAVIMGHEHPSIAIRDDVGARHRYKVFLSGSVDSTLVTVLPSISPLAYGSDMNEILPQHRLSPMLKNENIGDMVPYLLEVGLEVKEFPKMKNY